MKKEEGISSLPDCLLIEIISRLDLTKEAIKTSTLSKRWQHLWTQVPNLILIHQRYTHSATYPVLFDRGQNLKPM